MTSVLQYQRQTQRQGILFFLPAHTTQGVRSHTLVSTAETVRWCIVEIQFSTCLSILLTGRAIFTASAILNDDIRQEIAEKVGDFYMLPSLIHETLIIPKDAGMEFKELEQMVREVNQTQVAPGERLSDHVYEYDAKEHELFRSDRAEERAKQKEEKRDNRHERVSVKENLAEKKDAVIKMNTGKEHSAPEKKKEAVI